MGKRSIKSKAEKSTATERVTLYHHSPGNITTRQAVELIAAVVHPDESPIDARKRVRERIRYARRKGAVTKSDSLDAPEFFEWALGQPEWRASLLHLEGLPRVPGVVGNASLTLPMMQLSASGFQTPIDPQELRDEFSRVSIERIRLIEENVELKSHIAELKSRVAELEAEVAGWKEEDRSRRAKSSESGKKGGRGNTI